jgi:uncharacterized protein with von Willebrand factor type A (vWA) domain
MKSQGREVNKEGKKLVEKTQSRDKTGTEMVGVGGLSLHYPLFYERARGVQVEQPEAVVVGEGSGGDVPTEKIE